MKTLLLQIPLLDAWILPDSWGATGAFLEGAFIILFSFILGYLIRRWVNMGRVSNLEMTISALEDELARLKAENRELKASVTGSTNAEAQLKGLRTELDDCKKARLSLDGQVSGLKADLDAAKAAAAAAAAAPSSSGLGIADIPATTATPPEVSASAPVIPLPKGVKKDDLKIVEGIGPKIEQLLHAEEIMTWLNLSNTDPARIKEILMAAGPRYRIHNPGTWPRQALLAHEGKWTELDELQDRLKGGKEV